MPIAGALFRSSPREVAQSHTVVITGASSGLGRALAFRYAREGAILGLLGRSADRLDEVAERCRKRGAVVSTAMIDVRDRPAMEQWLKNFDDRSPIDILIANAGVMAGRPAQGAVEATSASHALMEINVLGVLNSVHPVVTRMMARRRGQIGLVSSLAAFVPLPDKPSYCASKSAIRSYGLALRILLRESGIGVSVICPGHIITPMMQRASGRKPFAIRPEAAADLIVRGLQRNRSTIAFPLLLALGARICGLLPDSVRRWTLQPFRSTVATHSGTG